MPNTPDFIYRLSNQHARWRNGNIHATQWTKWLEEFWQEAKNAGLYDEVFRLAKEQVFIA